MYNYNQNLIARTAFALGGVVLVMATLLTTYLLADNWTTDETTTSMRISSMSFMIVPMFFTALIACLNEDWQTRLGGGVVALIVTALAAGMFTTGASAHTTNILAITALVGSAVGSIAGEATRERDIWINMTNIISNVYYRRISTQRSYRWSR